VLAVGALLACAGAGGARDPAAVAELPLNLKGADRVPNAEWLEFSPDGRWLAACVRVASARIRVQVWDRTDWGTVHADFDYGEQSSSGIRARCAFDPKGTAIYAAGAGLLHVLPLPLTGPPRSTRLPFVGKTDRAAHAVSLLEDGKTLQVVTDEYAVGARVDRGPADAPERLARVLTLPGKVPGTRRLESTPEASPGGGLMSVVTTAPGAGGTVEVWGTTPPYPVTRIATLPDFVMFARFSPDGRTLATGCGDGGLRLFDLATGKVTHSARADFSVSSADFHPSRPLVVFSTFDKDDPNLRVLDLKTGRVVGGRVVDKGGLVHARFSPEGKFVATLGGEEVVRIFDLDRLMQK
jgi:WD40 repeat protein